MQVDRIGKIPVVLFFILVTGGCSSLGESFSGNRETITIRSEPSQAIVLADGAEIGTTPLTFKPGDAFRAGVTTSGSGILAYRYLGKLMVKKPGCKDYLTEVDDNILSKDIDVKLECDPDYRPLSVPAAPAVTAPDPLPSMPASAEERLQRIDALREKGLISDVEHRKLRQRVLDTL